MARAILLEVLRINFWQLLVQETGSILEMTKKMNNKTSSRPATKLSGFLHFIRSFTVSKALWEQEPKNNDIKWRREISTDKISVLE